MRKTIDKDIVGITVCFLGMISITVFGFIIKDTEMVQRGMCGLIVMALFITFNVIKIRRI